MRSFPGSAFAWLLIVLAAGKIGIWAAIGAPSTAQFPRPVLILIVVVFSGTAAALLYGARRDRRAAPFAICWVLAASSFTVFDQAELHGLPVTASRLLQHLSLLAFLPYANWVFFSQFPRVPLFARGGRLLRVGTRVSATVGAVLFLASMAYGIVRLSGAYPRLELLLERQRHFHTAIYMLLTLPAYVLALYRVKIASIQDRRRVRLLVFGVVIGSLPIVILPGLYALIPPFRAILMQPAVFLAARILAYGAVLSIPISTAYAVLVRRALDVRLVVRRTLQYALARYTALALLALPFALFLLLIYRSREQTVGNLVMSLEGGALLSVTVLGSLLLGVRRRVLDRIDVRFFREQYDARKTLEALIEKANTITGTGELRSVLNRELESALHPDSVTLLQVDAERGLFLDHVRPLSTQSQLARAAFATDHPIVLDADPMRTFVRTIPLSEQVWLADGGFELLGPVRSREGERLGMLALGSRKSELPYSAEDQRLIASICSSVATAMESLTRGSRESTSGSRERAAGIDLRSDELAAECSRCGRVDEPATPHCRHCNLQMAPASLPLQLAGKFRIECRLGKGGMGVVYRGMDLDLDRRVAIKTLPRLDPQYAPQLRREARFMASVTHPNLALIYGVESWRGTPMVVLEYLSGDTLSARLRKQPLAVDEAIDLSITLARVTASIHAAGILHRDIKPSNIGFDGDGNLKLLDFGVAGLMEALRRSNPPKAERSAALAKPQDIEMAATLDRSLVPTKTLPRVTGTLPYLSPEALEGAEPQPSFDVWSICMVLYESIAGGNPALAASSVATMERIRNCHFAEIRSSRPDCPEDVATFLREALSRGPRRPRRAADLVQRLESLRRRLHRPTS